MEKGGLNGDEKGQGVSKTKSLQDEEPEQSYFRLESLPLEIINLIILYSFDGCRDRERSSFPAVILTLSRRFRDISLTLPEIWSYIRISRESKVEIIRQTIQRSRNKHLEVEILWMNRGSVLASQYAGERTFEDAYPLLAPHTGRIASLRIEDVEIGTPRLFEDFIHSNSWPILHTLSLERCSPDYWIDESSEEKLDLHITSQSFPSIVELRLEATELRVPLSNGITVLTLAYWVGPYPLQLVYLRELQHLEQLHITQPFCSIPSYSLEQALQEYGPPIVLSRLQVFTIKDVVWRHVSMLLCFLQTPSLIELSISLEEEEWDDVIDQWFPEFGETAWTQIAFPQLTTLKLENTDALQEDLVLLLSRMPSSLTQLSIHRDRSKSVYARPKTIEQFFRPELARLRSQLTHIKFFGVTTPDIVSLVCDGGCTSLASLILDLESSTFSLESNSWKDAEKHSVALNAIRGLEGVDVELCVPNASVTSGMSIDRRCVDMDDWRERFPDEFRLAQEKFGTTINVFTLDAGVAYIDSVMKALDQSFS